MLPFALAKAIALFVEFKIMASTYSFDIVSDFDHQEMVNAVDQVKRELTSRYDLKSTQSTVELSDEKIVVNTDSEFTLTRSTTSCVRRLPSAICPKRFLITGLWMLLVAVVCVRRLF